MANLTARASNLSEERVGLDTSPTTTALAKHLLLCQPTLGTVAGSLLLALFLLRLVTANDG